jgi:uncharacterized membrane protein YcaP (DUF421 family)
MESYEIHLNDIARILTGNAPVQFFIEVLIRAVFVYAVLMVSMRLMGKRMASRMNRNELAAISTLAAAIGIPLLTPDRGLLPGLIIAIIVIIMQRTIAHYSAKSQRFERLTQGAISTLVNDGRLEVKNMKTARISREQLFSRLRSHGVRHLGEIRRTYIEANGSFTIIKRKEPTSGLCFIPDFDTDFINEQQRDKERVICGFCGDDKMNAHHDECGNCDRKEWVNAIH